MAKKGGYAVAVALGAKLNKSFGQTTEKATKSLEGVKKAAAGIGKAMAAVGVASVAAIGAASVAVFNIGKDFQEDYKTIANGTGATGKELEGLVDSYRKVGAASDEALADTAAVITDLNKRLGLTGEPLEAMAGAIMDLGDIAKEDFATIAAESAKMMNAFDIAGEDGAKALDKVWVASQSTGIGVTELMGKINENGAAFRAMGLDQETSIAMLANWEKQGLNTSTMLSGMNLAAKNLAKKGVKDMNKGLNDVFDKIKKAPNDTKAAKIALDVFGKGGVAMSDAIRSGAMDVSDLVSQLQNSEGTIEANAKATETFSEKLATMKNKVVTSLQPLAGKVMDSLGGALEKTMPFVEKMLGKLPGIFDKVTSTIGPILEKVFGALDTMGPILEDLFTSLFDVAGPVIDVLLSSLGDIVPVLGELVKGLSPLIVQAVKLFGDIIKPMMPFLARLISSLLPVLITAFQSIMRVLEPIIPVFTSIVTAILPPLTTLLGLVGDALTELAPLFDFLGKVIATSLTSAFEVIKPILDALIPIFSGIVDFISNVFAGNWAAAWESVKNIFKGVFDALIAIAKAPINFIIKAINTMLGGLNKLKIPDWVPLIGGKGFNIPLIPELAKGTDFFKGGLALVGERGPELVNMPRGSSVTPAQKTDELLSAGGRGEVVVHYSPNVVVEGNADEDAIVRALGISLRELKKMLSELGQQQRRVSLA